MAKRLGGELWLGDVKTPIGQRPEKTWCIVEGAGHAKPVDAMMCGPHPDGREEQRHAREYSATLHDRRLLEVA